MLMVLLWCGNIDGGGGGGCVSGGNGSGTKKG